MATTEATGAFGEREQAAFLDWACGDKDAARLMNSLAQVSQIADDFADGDFVPGERSRYMHDLLLQALVAIPLNNFFLKHRDYLIPIMYASINYWEASNTWARAEQRETRMYAFVYRDCLQMVFTAIAAICGGPDNARRVTREQHLLWQTPVRQTFEEWEAEEATRATAEKVEKVGKEAANG